MKMACGFGLALALVAPACSFGSGSAATILVDHEHDTFATQFSRYFPDGVQVRSPASICFSTSNDVFVRGSIVLTSARLTPPDRMS